MYVRQYLDLVTNRITMYRLMIYVLAGLAGIATTLAFMGVLRFSPVSMIVGLGILVTMSVATNLFFTFLFGMARRHESSLISALILFFIFSPPSSVSDGILLGFVAIIAMASKYLLVWKGRHIFNPSAVAAVIIGLTGLQFASWWVSAPSMLIPTLIGGLLIVYKTRRLKMALLFMGVSAALVGVVGLVKGATVGDILPILFAPVLFFGAFMLTEPLTLPPRAYQRTIVAVVVAVIIALQLQIGGVSITPEIALIMGNLYAFWCGQRKGIRLTLARRRELQGNQVEYTFEPSSPLSFTAGQYIELQLTHPNGDTRGTRRMFSITSSPTESVIKICTRHYDPSSTFKQALRALPIGSIITATGVYGDFILPDDPSEKLLLVAGGIGLTPFHSQLQWLLKTGKQRDGILLYSVRERSDAIYKDVLLASEHGIETHIVVGPVTDDVLRKNVLDIADRVVYISGPPAMVDGVELLAKRMGAKRIVKDYFSGY